MSLTFAYLKWVIANLKAGRVGCYVLYLGDTVSILYSSQQVLYCTVPCTTLWVKVKEKYFQIPSLFFFVF